MPENFEIAYPWVFVLLPIPLLVYWLFPAIRIKSSTLLLSNYQKAISYSGEKPKSAAEIKKRSIFFWIWFGIIWIAIISSLSSPQIVGKPELQVKTSRNFLITADISFSMATKDWMMEGEKVRRWDAVKSVMHDFIKKREGDRMGLIFFASSAYIQAPFTPELETVDQLLEEADVGMAGQMTYIGKAITKGIEIFEKDSLESKVMLLITDGVDGGSDILPLDAADLARKDSVVVHTIGIGEPGESGSDLDEETLEEIAELTGGQYFRAKDKERLEEIYTELDKLEPIEFEEKEYRPVRLLYPYPLALAIGMLMLYFLISMILNLERLIIRKEAKNV
ncbi:VWA domain-containing protein [Gramella lutea]|uniref:VWA domain-containing protein n=1 Tax=Christiangramia lutea TaxID=1607951 RepID=A0A9X1V000_9FLAO|nr:VWA domain-containing protein [Christiangramia lutea]MCH4821752.1 VWA domain-containing protein [Christiangramia lutea]